MDNTPLVPFWRDRPALVESTSKMGDTLAPDSIRVEIETGRGKPLCSISICGQKTILSAVAEANKVITGKNQAELLNDPNRHIFLLASQAEPPLVRVIIF